MRCKRFFSETFLVYHNVGFKVISEITPAYNLVNHEIKCFLVTQTIKWNH